MKREISTMQHPELMTVKQFCEHYTWATEGGIRHLIFHAEQNGFSKCIRRLGSRILLDVDEVFEWVKSN